MKLLLAFALALLLAPNPTPQIAFSSECNWALSTLAEDIRLDQQDMVWYPDDADYYADAAKTWQQATEYVRQVCGLSRKPAPECRTVATWFAWARDVHRSYLTPGAANYQWNTDWAARYQRLLNFVGCSYG